MRKYILLFIALCLHGLARGQTSDYTSFYWFDNQQGKPTVLPTVDGTFDIDASALSDGLHAFHYIVAMKEGGLSAPFTSYFLKASQDEEPIKGFYWFDSQQGKPTVLPTVQGLFDLDVSSLSEGLHSFHYAAMKEDGGISTPYTGYFLKTPFGDATIKGLYWFDNEPTAYEAPNLNGLFNVDVSSLSDGFHQFSFIASQSGSGLANPSTCYFLKIAQVAENDSLTCLCSVDRQLRHIEKLPQQGGVIHWNLDMQDISDGIHHIQLQAVTKSGALSNSYSTYFMRLTSMEELSEMRCVYAIDGSSMNSNSNVVGHDGSYHFDLDLSDLEEGLHYISFLLHNERGSSTKVQTRFFLKTPPGGNGITQYQYWLNDESIEQAKTVTLPEKVNPLQLMSLLPVESRPLRSSLFHFDTSSGKPMVYAKNTIHLRFYDSAMRFSDAAKDYVDYSQSCKVEPVGELQATQTFPTIEENDIRWYTMQSAPGDTVAFKLSQPATIQLFTPSGAEVFKTSESASVNWGGIHVWEDGTYYLAVHDVTGSMEEMTLDYMHMDKYDVVDWDVHTVGNGGCSTITFKGNGFRDLYAVDLVVAPGDTVHSVFVSHGSDAETEIAFDFTGATLGDYNAVFHFTEEDKHIASVVTVEEAIDIELATEVNFPSSFLRGTSTTYTIKITNKGNMTAYNVPLTIKISNFSNNDISHIALDGLGLKKLIDYIEDFEGLTQSEIESLKQLSKTIGEDRYFVKFKSADERGDSIYIRTGLFGLNIPPTSTKTISLTLTSSEKVDVWVAVANEMLPISSNVFAEHSSQRIRRKSNFFCCHYEQINCFLSVAVNISDVVGLFPTAAPVADIISCAGGALKNIISASAIAFCNKNEVEMSILDRLSLAASGIDVVSTLLSCAKKFNYGGKMMELIANGFNLSLGPGSTAITCASAFSQTKPNCPPCTGDCGGGGTSTPAPPSDPNDIYGYLSEAGSKFIVDSVALVNYTIEFENDTTFATAAAHTIVIKDTLDSRYFDLTKFMPTGIRIGEHEAFLNEDHVVTKNDKITFVKTIDMRPEINAIAQVDGEYNQKNGIATWTFTSLDPMTMEPTDDLMQGILPVNYNGTSGIGEVMFEVGMKQGKADGTEIRNRAGIVFDYEEAILTPTWTNIVDAVPPTSSVEYTSTEKVDTVTLHFAGEDARSGVWRYTVYVQDGKNAPWREVGVTDSCAFDFEYAEGIDYGFCVLATDSAGNVEQKELAREAELRTFIDGDANSDGVVDTKDAVLVISYYLGRSGTYLNVSAADIVEDGVIDTKDAVAIINKYLNTSTSSKAIKNRKRIRVL